MTSIRVAHTADIHAVYEAYGAVDPATGMHTRHEEVRRVVRFMVEKAIAERVDLFVLAGDLFKSRRSQRPEVLLIREGLLMLEEAGIPAIVVRGNHCLDPDDEEEKGAWAWLKTLVEDRGCKRILLRDRPSVDTIMVRGTPVHVATLPAARSSRLIAALDLGGKHLPAAQVNHLMVDHLATIVRGQAAQIPSGDLGLLVAHWAMDGAITSSEQILSLRSSLALPLQSVALPQFQAVLLGDIHRQQEFPRFEGGPWVGYSGSPYRIDFGEEADQKVFLIHQFSRSSGQWHHEGCEAISTPCRRFVTVTANLVGADIGADMADRLMEAVASSGHDLQDAIVRVKVRTEAQGASHLRRDEVTRRLLEAGVHFVGAVEVEVERELRVRDAEMRETMTVREALTRWFALRPDLESIRDEALTAADALERMVS